MRVDSDARSPKCVSCGIPFEDHEGIQKICHRLKEKRTMDTYLIGKIAAALAACDACDEIDQLRETLGATEGFYPTRVPAREWEKWLHEALDSQVAS